MHIYRSDCGSMPRGAVMALGNFDGVHLGHRELIRRGIIAASSAGKDFGVWTLTFTDASDRIMTDTEKCRVFEDLGADFVILENFSDIRNLSPKEFVYGYLVEKMHIAGAVCGFNYHFGRGAAGEAALLTELLGKHGVPVVTVPPVTLDGDLVSSTNVRALIAAGDMETVSRMMGGAYSISGKVHHGSRLGHELGFPTVNLIPESDRVLPKFGVYESRTVIGDTAYPSVSNIGIRPTVDGKSVTLETFIFGYDGDLYGKGVTVEFLRFMRGEVRFADTGELKQAVLADIDKVREKIKQRIIK